MLPMLSDGFPRMDIEYKNMLESDEAKQSVAPKKKHAMASAGDARPVADATPLTTGKPIDAMDVGSDGDDDGAGDE